MNTYFVFWINPKYEGRSFKLRFNRSIIYYDGVTKNYNPFDN